MHLLKHMNTALWRGGSRDRTGSWHGDFVTAQARSDNDSPGFLNHGTIDMWTKPLFVVGYCPVLQDV